MIGLIKSNKQKFFKYFLIGILVFFFIIYFTGILKSEIATRRKFSKLSINLNAYDLHDLGVVDVNDDGLLDIFTTNHSALQSLLINNGNQRFTDSLVKYGLSQAPEFAGLEVSERKIELESPGIYIYREKNLQSSSADSDNYLAIRAHRVRERGKIQGKLTIPSSVKIKRNKNFKVEIKENKFTSGGIQTSIFFEIADDGELIIEDLTALPILFELNNQIPLELVHIGLNKLHPQSSNFELSWKDRHGMAWADYDGDGVIDVFISRGALKGLMASAPDLYSDSFFNDELLKGSSEGFKDKTVESKVYKKACPGRQTGWVDFDNDNRLDLYVVCGRDSAPSDLHPNQLYRQLDEQNFIDTAPRLRLDFPEKGVFSWLDVDNDADMDFFWISAKSFQLYLNQDGNFKPQPSIKNEKGEPRKLSIADFNSDGLLDIYAVVGSRGILLKNEGSGIFKHLDSDSLGLPERIINAAWVDYNNDGLSDLYTISSGIYRQNKNHHFEKTHILEHQSYLSRLNDARCTWFDINNDGLEDLLVALKYRPWWVRVSNFFYRVDRADPRNWEVFLYKNKNIEKNNWLEVNLVGDAGNYQAIGARVSVKTKDIYLTEQIGQAENSHYSQGHYRLYFGFHRQDKIDILRVAWPDGKEQILTDISVNRLLTIHKNKKIYDS